MVYGNQVSITHYKLILTRNNSIGCMTLGKGIAPFHAKAELKQNSASKNFNVTNI